MLDLIGVPGFFSLDDDGGADDMVCCSDVDQQSFTRLWSHHNWRRCEELFELGKGLVSFRHLGKLLQSFEQLEER